MNADEHGFDSRTEQVLAAVFEVSIVLGFDVAPPRPIGVDRRPRKV
jgi:hypothetical protein